jgi:predicted nucleic acid-binding protein
VTACLLDTNVVAWIRDNELEPTAYVGSDDLAISDTVAAELQGPLPSDHPIVQASWALVRASGGRVVDDTIAEVLAVATSIMTRYRLHEPPADDPADALIAAAAMLTGRVLVTRNWKHFHYVAGLRYLGARGPQAEDLLGSVGVAQGGPTELPCCRRLPRGPDVDPAT